MEHLAPALMKVRSLLLALACAGAVVAIGADQARALAFSGRLDTRIELGQKFTGISYWHQSALVGPVGRDGANGVNRDYERGTGPGMFIEEQRHGEEAILAGVALHHPRWWRIGLRELSWGFAHQGPQGNFPATQDAFHSTAFFVEAVAHLTLLLRTAAASGITLPAHLLAQVADFLPRLHAAARWMARAEEWRPGLAGDAPYTHRRFLVASALGLTAELTGDRLLRARAREALELGLKAQRPDGIDPELGGYDSSYQARGLVYAEDYLAWVGRDPLAANLQTAIARGLAWERTRILHSGRVSTVGNTRANGVMVDHNGPKRVVYPMVAGALGWWGLAAGVPSDVRLAARVSRWGAAHPAEVGT
jgi:hypothetical protein